MNTLEELSERVSKIGIVNANAVSAFKKLIDAMNEAARQVSEQSQLAADSIEELRQLVDTLKEYPTTEWLLESLSFFYIQRTPIPKTPYKPSFKTVIFDKRLKFPKCRSNCR